MKLGEKILSYRKKLGLSQEELGDKVGVSRQTVSKWEIGQTIPELEKMILLAKEFETTIDELVKDENELEQNENQVKTEKQKNNKLVKLFKCTLIIIITVIGIVLGVILYRYLMICGLKNKFTDAGKEPPIDENGVSFSMENYRIRENISKVEYNTYTDTKEITYYNLENKYKKIYGDYYEPDRIEYADYDANEYYDIDCINKTYKKSNAYDLPVEIQEGLTEKDCKINVEILANFDLSSSGKWKIATNFDYNIEVIDQGYYINNYKYYEDFISFNVSKWRVRFEKYEYEDKVNLINTSYTIDYGVADENLVRLPDLTDYTEIQD